MVFLVPYDGTPQTTAALERAVSYGAALDHDVVATTLVPTGESYAERRQWIDPSEDFAVETAADDLQRKIEEATADAELRFEDSGAHAPDGGLSEAVRRVAREVDADVVFLGGAGDGRVVVPVDGEGADFDVHVVRGR
ncbi:universal stress protein [Halomicrobium urmianum]|uniref:universal stress protein n=1 Tax=Halomicrobium urmianum TaxID=1586233 RepID=UPI001CD96288|nr:universal stress protein [Halomicrobium urmianum]